MRIAEKKAFYVYLAAAFLDILGMVVTAPLLPYIAEVLEIPVRQFGLVLATYQATFLLSSLVTGTIVQRLGFRHLSIVMAAGTSLSFAIVGLSGLLRSLPLYLAGRAVGGLFAGAPTIVQGYICTFPESSRLAMFVQYGTIVSVSVLSGRLTLLLAEIDYFAPLWLCAIAGLLLLLACILFAVDRTNDISEVQLPKSVTAATSTRETPNKILLALALSIELLMAADMMAFTAAAEPAILVQLYGLEPYEITAVGFGNVAIQLTLRLLVVKPLVKRFSGRQRHLGTFVFLVSLFQRLPFFSVGPGSFWLRYFPSYCVWTLLWSVTYPIAQASLQNIEATYAGTNKAFVMGAREVMLNLGRTAVGPLGSIFFALPYPYGPVIIANCCQALASLVWMGAFR